MSRLDTPPTRLVARAGDRSSRGARRARGGTRAQVFSRRSESTAIRVGSSGYFEKRIYTPLAFSSNDKGIWISSVQSPTSSTFSRPHLQRHSLATFPVHHFQSNASHALYPYSPCQQYSLFTPAPSPLPAMHLQLRPRATTYNHALSPINPRNGIADHLIHDCLCALPLVDHGSSLAHQERARVVHGIVVNVIAQGFKVVLNGDGTLASKIFDFLRPVFFPVLDIGVVADAERTALE